MQGNHPSASGHYPDPHDRRTSHRPLQRGRKAPDATLPKTNQGRGKDVERKCPNADFPSQLANPAHYAGFALSHRHDDDCWMILLLNQKPDTSLAQKSGHFYLLTTLPDSPPYIRHRRYHAEGHVLLSVEDVSEGVIASLPFSDGRKCMQADVLFSL